MPGFAEKTGRGEPADRQRAVLQDAAADITAAVAGELDDAVERMCCRRRRLEHHLEGCEAARPSRQAAHVVLAGGQDRGAGFQYVTPDLDPNAASRRLDRPRRLPAQHCGAGALRGNQHRLVERAARNGDAGEGQRGDRGIAPRDEPQALGRPRAHGANVDAEIGQHLLRLEAQEIAADLVLGRALALDNRDPPAPAQKLQGKGCAGQPAADRDRIAPRHAPLAH
jgi:hypothetical protein